MNLEFITADVLLTLLEEVLAERNAGYFKEELPAFRGRLEARAKTIAELLTGRAADDTLKGLRANVRTRDGEHDDAHRLAYFLAKALSYDRQRPAVAQAARLIIAALWWSGLDVVNLAADFEVAAGKKFEAILGREDVRAAIATLSEVVPGYGAMLDAVVSAGKALGQALDAIRAQEVDQAGKPFDPKLFRARNEALQAWSAFANLVDVVYPAAEEDHASAREALLGKWQRLLSLSRTPKETVTPEPAPMPAPEPQA